MLILLEEKWKEAFTSFLGVICRYTLDKEVSVKGNRISPSTSEAPYRVSNYLGEFK